MALALAIVSFLYWPIVGTLLVEAALGNCTHHWDVRSLALALPFMLFAMFPGWLNST
jgi:thiol:disulfide interchange protein DsbD